MTRRIFLTVVAATVLAVVLFGVPLALVLHRRIHDDALIELQRVANEAIARLPTQVENADPSDLPPTEAGLVVAVYDRTGRLVTGQGPAEPDAVVLATRDGSVHNGVVGSERVLAVPLPGDEQAAGAVRAAEPRDEVRDRELGMWAAMIGVGALAVALAAGAGTLLGRRLTRPVQRLRDASVRLGQGDFTVTAPHSGIAELDEAGDALGITARRLGTILERERTFAADASHQLRTPLASLRLALENELADPRSDPSVALHEALTDVDRLDDTITRLLALTRARPEDRQPIAVENLVRAAEGRWHGPLAAEGRPLRVVDGAPSTPVLASPAAVSTVLDVLLDNALRHGAGTVTIWTQPAPRTGVLVVVADEGEISAREEEIFTRRTPTARHHGIGLPLARSLAEAEGLRLLIGSRRPTAFQVLLPAAP